MTDSAIVREDPGFSAEKVEEELFCQARAFFPSIS
jgi:hypothetical protein